MTKDSPVSSSGIDLGGLFDEDSAPCFINDETGRPVIGSDGKPWFVTMAGPAHPKSVEARNRALRQVMKSRRKSQKALDNVTDTEIEEVVKGQIEPIALRTIGWGPIILGGKDFTFTAANATQMIQTSSLIRGQLAKFLEDESAFLGKRKTQS